MSAAFQYDIREHARARHLRLVVHEDGSVVVTKPKRVSMRAVEAFIHERTSWVLEAQAGMQALQERNEKRYGVRLSLPRLRRDTAAYRAAISQARVLVHERIQYFAQLGNFTYGTISIRNQASRWGSCSAANNLSFNYRIIYLPIALADYLIVHELAHTKHHNHSATFWSEVGKYVPQHLAKRKELHRYRW